MRKTVESKERRKKSFVSPKIAQFENLLLLENLVPALSRYPESDKSQFISFLPLVKYFHHQGAHELAV